MAEVVVSIPKGLEKEVKELSKEELEKSFVEFLRFKLFESKLKRSRELRHLLFKTLIAKSKLTEEDALELGKKVNESMLKELKDKGLI